MFLTEFSILLFLSFCNHVFTCTNFHDLCSKTTVASSSSAAFNVPTHEGFLLFSRELRDSRSYPIPADHKTPADHTFRRSFTSTTAFRSFIFLFMNDTHSGSLSASSMRRGTYHREFSLPPIQALFSPLWHRNSMLRYLPRGAA